MLTSHLEVLWRSSESNFKASVHAIILYDEFGSCTFKSTAIYPRDQWVNTLRPIQDGRHFPDDIFSCIFLNEYEHYWIKISLKFVPKPPINNIPALAQIMAWHRSGDKPLSKPMMVLLSTHICVTRPQWVKGVNNWLTSHQFWTGNNKHL